jgi:hypothetical protein
LFDRTEGCKEERGSAIDRERERERKKREREREGKGLREAKIFLDMILKLGLKF